MGTAVGRRSARRRAAVRLTTAGGRVPAAFRLALPLGLTGLALTLSLATHRLDVEVESAFPLVRTPRWSASVARLAGPPTLDLDRVSPAPVPLDLAFRRGETLGAALQGLGLSPLESAWAADALAGHLDVRRIRPGDRYSAWLGDDSRVAALQFVLEDRGRVRLERAAEGWDASFLPYERRMVSRTVKGTVEGAFVAAVSAAGARPDLAYRMADVLQWDLDFSRDLRRGDRFEVAYDVLEVEGRRRAVGDVWALTFVNGDRRIEAYRFGEDGGYYDGEGRPLEKMFLRSPLKLAHVTSRFSHRRLHPVLKTYRPHWGVDYRASVGTPVRVTASGVVVFAGWSRGAGKMVKVRHPNGYLTAYLHLSRFAPGIRPGRRVGQGDLVAYSGSTGLSTAPHLDYRVQKNGRWIDPLALDNVPAEPIARSQLAAFHVWRDVCRESLSRGTPLPYRPRDAGTANETLLAELGVGGPGAEASFGAAAGR